MGLPIYTIGHSNHSLVHFMELLAKHDVTAIADVRSRPYSRFNPQFNRESLQVHLKRRRIAYVFLGRELGARSEEASCYVEGAVQYDLLAKTEHFRSGIARLTKGAISYRIALLCAEKDPLTCHRAILVCRHLPRETFDIFHIVEDGSLESHDRALERLLKEQGTSESDLFRPRDAVIRDALDRRGRDIAYVERTPESSTSQGAIGQ